MLKNSLYTLKIGVLVEPSDKLKEIEKLKEKNPFLCYITDILKCLIIFATPTSFLFCLFVF